jgi:hypothetical protein
MVSDLVLVDWRQFGGIPSRQASFSEVNSRGFQSDINACNEVLLTFEEIRERGDADGEQHDEDRQGVADRPSGFGFSSFSGATLMSG